MIKLKDILQKEFIEGFDLEKFKQMRSYAEKIRYANEKLQRLTSGSARVIYKIDDNRVLKLAKNEKGIAQNNTESDYMMNDWYGDIIAGVLESDEDDRWVVSKYAKKISPSRFKQLLGMDIKSFYSVLWQDVKGKYSPFVRDVPEEDKNTLHENEFYSSILDMVGNFDLEIGDFDRISSFGEIDGHLVVVDYGLTQATYKQYYARK